MASKKPAWNSDRMVGQKRAFSTSDISALTRKLELEKRFRELCLFCLGIDTMFRSCDLIQLRVCDVMDDQHRPKTEIGWRQKKTKKKVKAAINPYTQSAVSCFVQSQNLGPDDFLFTSRKSGGRDPISTNYLRRIVKKWATEIGLDPAEYSGHSLRRTKPAFMYAKGVQPPPLRILLGQKSLESTQEYLGIDEQEALTLARQYDIFKEI